MAAGGTAEAAAAPKVVGTYAPSTLHGGSSRVIASKVALLPPLSGSEPFPASTHENLRRRR